MAVRCANKSCDTVNIRNMKISGGNIHSAGMHMRQMQILLSGGKSAADMAFGLVDIENVTRLCGKLRSMRSSLSASVISLCTVDLLMPNCFAA